MIIQSLVSRSLPRQLLPLSLVIVPVLIRCFIAGITIHVPEDSTMLYLWLAGHIAQWGTPWPEITVILMYGLLAWLLYRTARFQGFHQRGSGALTLFLVVFALLAFPENLGVHPTLIMLLFLVPAFRNILLCSDPIRLPARLFNAGFLASMASLFSFSAVLFLPSFFVVLFVFRLYRWNYSAMLATGMLLPWLYPLLWGWMTGVYPLEGLYGMTSIWLSGVIYALSYVQALFSFSHYAVVILTSIFMILSFLSVFSKLDQRVLAMRFLYRSVLWLALPGIPYLIVSGGMILQAMMVGAFFIAVVGTTYLREIKRYKQVNLLLWGLVVFMLFGYIVL